MIPTHRDLDEEDEDVVIAGSELHEALSKMGYWDYEVVPISNEQPLAAESSSQPAPKKSDGWYSQILYKHFYYIYRSMMKDKNALRKQLTTISKAQHLLDDHAELIKSLLDKDGETKSGRINKFLPYIQFAAVAAVGYFFINRSNRFIWLVTLPALTAARYEYTKWRTNRDLKRLILEQTELYYVYKRALRILNHSFRMNTSPKQSGFKFTDLGAEKLKFLQPITEKTLKSLATMSIAYYDTTLRMAKLLPDSYQHDFHSQITYFDKETFTNYGEVTYDSLKQLFYRFILIQSEMLLILAVLRCNNPKDLCDEINREMKIDHRIKQLLELTAKHRASMTKSVDDFHNYKLVRVKDKYRGFHGSKWQDLYVRLHLTSHKMQKSYENITSVLDEIENHLDRRTDETELLERLKIKLNDVCSDASKARDLTQLSALIIMKMSQADHNRETRDADPDDNDLGKIPRQDLPMVKDTDPEIIDEVFEEYIRERYSETLLNQDRDDYFERTYKLDKLLSKNLMSELKEALVDKQKDTQERESKALKRMNKSPVEEIDAKDVSNGNLSLDHQIETESSDSKQELNLESNDGSLRNEPKTKNRYFNEIPRPPPPPMPKEFTQLRRELGECEKEEETQRPKCFVSLSSSSSIPLSLFLSNNEETFIGSGENSEEEVLDEDVGSTEEEDCDS